LPPFEAAERVEQEPEHDAEGQEVDQQEGHRQGAMRSIPPPSAWHRLPAATASEPVRPDRDGSSCYSLRISSAHWLVQHGGGRGV
jgi:hypothetical protein